MQLQATIVFGQTQTIWRCWPMIAHMERGNGQKYGYGGAEQGIPGIHVRCVYQPEAKGDRYHGPNTHESTY